MTDDLVKFLRARIDEDETAAQAAGGQAWTWDQGYGEKCNDPNCPYGALVTDDVVVMEVHGYDVAVDWEGGPHIERHHPARILAEVAAKRSAIEEYEAVVESLADYDPADGTGRAMVSSLRGVLEAAASIYAGHADYQGSWKP